MRDQYENFPLIDSQQLDRLVDGELSDDDRCRLIETLEQQPDKWRDCACAFLESQEFGTAFTDLISGAASTRTVTAAIDAPQVRVPASYAAHSPRSARRWWVVLAACLLLGFAVGRFMESSGSTPLEQAPLLVSEENDVSNGRILLTDSTNGLADDRSPLNRDQLFAGYGNGNGNSSAVPAEIETILDRLGHNVERRYVFVPVLSMDGRQGVIPVEQVDFVSVGLETY
jgi:hypothetical protein